MTLLSGDIRWAKSVNMTDVPEGGGPPSATLLTSGRSNEILPDISEETRTTGRTEIYCIHGVLRNNDRTPLLGANIILAEPASDPNVSLTLMTLKNTFATRADVAKRVEAGMTAGSEWGGYLLEDHWQTMRSVTLFQRPGAAKPVEGKTYLLIYNEGQPSERRQRIRLKSVSVNIELVTAIVNGQLVDFEAQISTCELFDALSFDFPGSPPSRFFTRASNKTLIRATVYSDAGMFYGAGRLTQDTLAADTWVKVDSIFTRVVPNSRTEVSTVDQRPTARSTIVLAETPRRVEVGITPHTQRILIDDVNVGLVYVFQLTSLPAPGTTFIDYWAAGQRYTVQCDGTGKLVGEGGGAVSLLTGAGTVTLKKTPDPGSFISITHGTATTYTDRSSQGAAVRAPEFPFVVPGDTEDDQIRPGTFSLEYPSDGDVYEVTDDGVGGLVETGSGLPAGFIDYPSRTVVLRPPHMIDPGAQFLYVCDLEEVVMEDLPLPTPDAGGYVALSLSQEPVAQSLQLQWAVLRTTTVTSGSQATPVNTSKTPETPITVRAVPDDYEPYVPISGPVVWTPPGPNALHSD